MIHYEYINERGRQLAERIAQLLSHTEEDGEAIVFIGALGICVRKILPLVNSKYTDPAVVCVDTTGKYVIPVLSGHVGGANGLSRRIAHAIGAEAVITTQSDNAGLWALDTIAKEYGWATTSGSLNDAIATFVNGKPTALLLDVADDGTDYMLSTLPPHVTLVSSMDEIESSRFKLAIIVSPRRYAEEISVLNTRCSIKTVHYIPRCIHVGIGLAHQAEPASEILGKIHSCIEASGICLEAIADYNTIDVKADEPVVRLLQEGGATVNFHTAEELSEVDVPNPSETVRSHVATPSVSEASAMLHGTLLMLKQKGDKWTVATSIHRREGHIEIVGAGPGDPDLVSVRGRKFLQRADLILYAGSLVPRQLTECHKPGATVRSSADMDLQEQFALMKSFYDHGKLVVRLHTGDPCIYGAIQEQMAYFDRYGMHYHITPGISSFLAAAAELQSQFTIPERCQTIILTRGEGRTPMPDKEKLHLLAQHQSTMCIFLSASIVDDVQQQLLQGGYAPDTPVAACYRLTWKDQRIYRGMLKDLADIVKGNGLTLTTMIVVGDAIDNREGLSKLYDAQFTHLYRNEK